MDNFWFPHLVIGEFGGVVQLHLLNLKRGVTGGQGQAAESVTAGTPLLNDGHDLVLDGAGQRYTSSTNTHISAPVNNTLGGTLLVWKEREEKADKLRER